MSHTLTADNLPTFLPHILTRPPETRLLAARTEPAAEAVICKLISQLICSYRICLLILCQRSQICVMNMFYCLKRNNARRASGERTA